MCMWGGRFSNKENLSEEHGSPSWPETSEGLRKAYLAGYGKLMKRLGSVVRETNFLFF